MPKRLQQAWQDQSGLLKGRKVIETACFTVQKSTLHVLFALQDASIELDSDYRLAEDSFTEEDS